MRKLFFLIVAACLLVTDAIAQKKDTIAYGLNLDEVQIVARRIRHANEANAGAKVTHLEPELLQINKTRSFSELLTENSATYIKSLGTGALSTASFRGGSAAQTRVNWNGINITPPMSGVFDFSQFPVFFADNVNLYYGSSHVKSGTGAVGGSVNIFNDPEWGKGVTGKFFGEYGASGRIRTSDRSVRSRVLYPAELRMQMAVRRGFEPRMQLLTAYSLSRGAPSASRPPHHTPLTSASKNLFIAHRRCVAHILLSETYKSNNFSHTFIVCTLHAQLVCKNVKKSVLSTEKRRSDR